MDKAQNRESVNLGKRVISCLERVLTHTSAVGWCEKEKVALFQPLTDIMTYRGPLTMSGWDWACREIKKMGGEREASYFLFPDVHRFLIDCNSLSLQPLMG